MFKYNNVILFPGSVVMAAKVLSLEQEFTVMYATILISASDVRKTVTIQLSKPYTVKLSCQCTVKDLAVAVVLVSIKCSRYQCISQASTPFVLSLKFAFT